MGKLFFLLFIIVPIIEIYLFIQIGGMIGAGNTVLIIIVTAIIGANMLRTQGLQTLARIQQSLQQFQLPAVELAEGVLIIIGGAFLLTPGFFTDTIGFLCLIPFTRRYIVGSAMGLFGVYIKGNAASTQESKTNVTSKANKERVIDGEYTDETDNIKK